MTFMVGQKIICVFAREAPGYGPFGKTEALIKGAVYTVTSAHVDNRGEPTLWLAEVARDETSRRQHGDLVGYRPHRFRPAVERKTDISIFKKLLTPNPELEFVD